MQLCSFYLIDQKRKSYGIVREEGVIDVGSRLGAECPDLKSLLQRGAVSDLEAFSSQIGRASCRERV